MTEIAPDGLINEHPRAKFEPLKPYGVACGDLQQNHGWGERYPFRRPARPPEDAFSTACPQGFSRVWRIDTSGHLILDRYVYPTWGTGEPARVDPVHEVLEGDFWLVMKHAFMAPRTWVCFRRGLLVPDQRHWLHEVRE